MGFLTTLGVNIGDEFIREGVLHCLEQLGLAVEPYFVNKHDRESLTSIQDVEIESIGDKIRNTDLFIQSGAPVYWHHGYGGHNSTLAEWHGWAWEERILPPGGPVFVNLGAGSCQAWGDQGDSFVADPACAEFAIRAGQRAALTTVRDPVAANILERLGVAHERLPCPAFLAAGRRRPGQGSGDLIAVNLMPKGGHYDFSVGLATGSWIVRLHTLLEELRLVGRILFLCHDREEEEFAAQFASGGERVFRAAAYRDYLDIFPVLTAIFANRVHAAVTAAGFGIPAMIAGSDTRARIGEWIGLRVFEARTLDPAEAAAGMAELVRNRGRESERLRVLRQETVKRYSALLEPVIARMPQRSRIRPKISAEHPVRRWLRLHGEGWRERIGLEPLWVIGESGLHPPEPYQGAKLRWTNGSAEFSLPQELEPVSGRLGLQLWGVHPAGYEFSVDVNGERILTAKTDEGGAWEGDVSFPEQQVRSIAIVSSQMRPDGDTRVLGVALRKLWLAAAGGNVVVVAEKKRFDDHAGMQPRKPDRKDWRPGGEHEEGGSSKTIESHGRCEWGKATRQDFLDQGRWTPQTVMMRAIQKWIGEAAVEVTEALSIDKNPTMEPLIREKWPKVRIHEAVYPEQDAMALRYPDSTFDLVFSHQVLEHIPRPWLAAQEMIRVLKPGGIGIHTTCAFNPRHGPPHFRDYYRFHPEGLVEIFGGMEVEECAEWGNREAIRHNVSVEDGHGELGGRRFGEDIGSWSDGLYPWHSWIIFQKPVSQR